MIDYLIQEYFKNKRGDSMQEQELEDNFAKYMAEKYGYKLEKIDSEESHSTHTSYKDESMVNSSHFDKDAAIHRVYQMYHSTGSKKCVGEKFTMDKAKEICIRYRSYIPKDVNTYDIYVAINEQYHNFAELFKAWFGEVLLEDRIIESAIVFWFKDEDYNGNNKIWKYLYK